MSSKQGDTRGEKTRKDKNIETSGETKKRESGAERRHQRVFWENKRTASFDKYKRQGVSVFMDQEELDKETLVQMESWGKPGRLDLLKRGDAFRMTPAPVRESETGIAVTRGAIDLLVGIRANLRMDVHGKWTLRDTKMGIGNTGTQDTCL